MRLHCITFISIIVLLTLKEDFSVLMIKTERLTTYLLKKTVVSVIGPMFRNSGNDAAADVPNVPSHQNVPCDPGPSWLAQREARTVHTGPVCRLVGSLVSWTVGPVRGLSMGGTTLSKA